MSARKRDDWDDDWDDEPAVKRKKKTEEVEPGGLTTSRILLGLAVLVVAALIVGGVLMREPMQLSEVPPQLVGTWTCNDEEHSDLWVEFERDAVTFGTGGTSRLRCRVLGSNADTAGSVHRFVVKYKDMAGDKHLREILVDASGTVLRFADRPDLRYNRYD